MDGFAATIARLIRAGQRAYTKKWLFIAVFALTFLVSVLTLGRLDLLPEAPVVLPVAAIERPVAIEPTAPELPVTVSIPSLDLRASITNPTATDIASLDRELLKGAVRYPTSAQLGEDGNVVLFGHSSYLPIVNNQAFKTFNGIQKLVAGDEIIVSSSSTAYTYRVRRVTKERATDAVIPLGVAGQVLTLSTCNSFASKDDRFVVVADLVESHPIST
jgi:LPXTG-site transpeptidase (sortase) family protein